MTLQLAVAAACMIQAVQSTCCLHVWQTLCQPAPDADAVLFCAGGVRYDDEQHQSQCQLHHSPPRPDGGAAVGAVVLHKRDTNYLGGAVQTGGHTHQPAMPVSEHAAGENMRPERQHKHWWLLQLCGLTEQYMAGCLWPYAYTHTTMQHILTAARVVCMYNVAPSLPCSPCTIG